MAKDKLDEFYENLDREYGKSNTDKNVDYVMSLIKQPCLVIGHHLQQKCIFTSLISRLWVLRALLIFLRRRRAKHND